MVEQIKAVCKEKKWSLAILEKKAGLKDRTVYRWDDNAPSIDKVVKAACALGVSVDYLCGLSKIKTPATESDGLNEFDKAILGFAHSLPYEQLRGILVAVKAPKELLDALDREAQKE